MCKKFTIEHQEGVAESISVEAKVSNNLLRETRTNDRYSNW
jgi:hypothetical protein